MATKKNGRAWTRRQAFDDRVWRPDQEDTSHVLQGVVLDAELKKTKYGDCQLYTIRTTAECVDAEGVIAKNANVMVWESAGLRALDKCMHEEVQIVPDGFGGDEGRRRDYVVSSRPVEPDDSAKAIV